MSQNKRQQRDYAVRRRCSQSDLRWRDRALHSFSKGTSAHASDHVAGLARSRPILTSLPLQIFIYFGGWWDALFWVLSLLVFIYKGALSRKLSWCCIHFKVTVPGDANPPPCAGCCLQGSHCHTHRRSLQPSLLCSGSSSLWSPHDYFWVGTVAQLYVAEPCAGASSVARLLLPGPVQGLAGACCQP